MVSNSEYISTACRRKKKLTTINQNRGLSLKPKSNRDSSYTAIDNFTMSPSSLWVLLNYVVNVARSTILDFSQKIVNCCDFFDVVPRCKTFKKAVC